VRPQALGIGRPTAHATSVRGGGRPESTRSRLPAGSGRRRAESDRGGPNDPHYLGRMTLPRPLTKRTRTSAPPQRRKKKLPCRKFPASRGEAAMWRPNESVEEGISGLPGNDLQNKRRRSRRRAWRDGLADKTVVKALEHVRSYRAFERALIASVDPRSVPETKNCCRRLCVRRSDRPTPSPNVSCASPILTRPCLTAWAATKRDYGARQRKRFGPSRRCDSRRLLCGSGCATGSRPSPGIARGRSRLTRSLDLDCSR
jgi:hypothetical protein